MLLSPQSFRLKVRCCFNHINTSGVALLQLTETRLSGARMQRLLSGAIWDVDGVRDEVRAFALEQLGTSAATVAIDETSFPKRGKHSAGVKKQYCGPPGQFQNCQGAFFLPSTPPGAHPPTDRNLYLPQDWTDDPARSLRAAIPDAIDESRPPGRD